MAPYLLLGQEKLKNIESKNSESENQFSGGSQHTADCTDWRGAVKSCYTTERSQSGEQIQISKHQYHSQFQIKLIAPRAISGWDWVWIEISGWDYAKSTFIAKNIKKP